MKLQTLNGLPYLAFVVVQTLSLVWLQPHGLQHTRLPCPSLSPRLCSNSCPLHQWCYRTISSSVIPFFSCLQSFPASGSFPVSWLLLSGGQNYWSFHFSISPSNALPHIVKIPKRTVIKKDNLWDFLGGPVVKNPGLISGPGIKILHDSGQLNPNSRVHGLQLEKACVKQQRACVLQWRPSTPKKKKKRQLVISFRLRKEEIMTQAATWINLEDIRLSEIHQSQKDKYYMIPLIWGI